ncbi:hypothetical protein AAFC00_004275 [Neodothiora populina]
MVADSPSAELLLDDAASGPAARQQETEMPMTMAASLILDHLPLDTHRVLSEAGRAGVPERITIHLKSLPNTPAMKQPRFKCDSLRNFEYVVLFLRRRLKVKDDESVCCYINSVFAPGLDEGIGNLWRCFKINDELVVSYSLTQAFG